jgi:hypothetical protein
MEQKYATRKINMKQTIVLKQQKLPKKVSLESFIYETA